MSEAVNLGSEDQFDKIISDEKPVIVDFWAPWCGPCKMQGPILDELAKEVGDAVSVVKVNVDDLSGLAQKYSIASIPTLMIFQNGKDLHTLVGVQSKDSLKKLLNL